MTKIIKTPLRYVGGKTKVARDLYALFPSDFQKFIEPFCGGSSMSIFALQHGKKEQVWVLNDTYRPLYLFWLAVKNHGFSLLMEIDKIKNRYTVGKELYMYCRQEILKLELLTTDDQFSNVVLIAACYFILNRITFSGLSMSGGYSEDAFRNRFTESSIEQLSQVIRLFNDHKLNILVTNADYEEIVKSPNVNDFIYLDPPYLSNRKSKLYGNHGDLHSVFNHQRLRNCIDGIKCKFLMSYDFSPEVLDLYKEYFIYAFNVKYSVRNKSLQECSEVIITNYELLALKGFQVKN
jgi:DNA adenine methylase